jgi:hypothetical protein
VARQYLALRPDFSTYIEGLGNLLGGKDVNFCVLDKLKQFCFLKNVKE